MIKLYCHDYNRGETAWRLLRTIEASDDVINRAIVKALETAPDMGHYKYECTTSNKTTCVIWSINSSIFD